MKEFPETERTLGGLRGRPARRGERRETGVFATWRRLGLVGCFRGQLYLGVVHMLRYHLAKHPTISQEKTLSLWTEVHINISIKERNTPEH